MSTRTLTDVYVLMRNNAIQRRDIYSDHYPSSDRMSLVRLSTRDAMGQNSPDIISACHTSSWASYLDEALFILSKVTDKLDRLKILHGQHLNRPKLDESSREELEIDNCTQEISSMFTSAHRLLTQIKSMHSQGSHKERQLNNNVSLALATSIQQLSTKYSMMQNSYLRQINSREQNTKQFFEPFQTWSTSNLSAQDDEMLPNVDFIDECFAQKLTSVNFDSLTAQNTQMAREREREITSIVRSISEINAIYKDLAQMVQQQGTILDRIDYNIENTHYQVLEGYTQLKKAEQLMRNNSKMYCIFVLATTTIVMTFLLIIIKF